MRILTIVIACLLPLAVALAEHEADHRYQVRGYLLDDEENAIARREVAIFSDGNLLARGRTDSHGYYALDLHLHNEDRGRLLTLRAGSDRADIRVNFDPQDSHTARVHDVNLVGGRLVEEALNRWRIPPWIYPLAGFILLGFALVMLERRRKRKLRRRQFGSAHDLHGKKKRKKH